MDCIYSNEPRVIQVKTYDLQNLATFNYYRAMGYNWIRRVETKNFNFLLREPTIGCLVELSTHKDVRCAHLDTPKARRLINTQNYYTTYMCI